jgi:hypothetical protein
MRRFLFVGGVLFLGGCKSGAVAVAPGPNDGGTGGTLTTIPTAGDGPRERRDPLAARRRPRG